MKKTLDSGNNREIKEETNLGTKVSGLYKVVKAEKICSLNKNTVA